MALRMSRNRTQTTLNKLVGLVANVHGELAFVEGLLAELLPGLTELTELRGEARKVGVDARLGPLRAAREVAARQVLLARRHAKLVAARDALYATVRQFDPELKPEDIGVMGDWLNPYGRKLTRATVGRYLAGLEPVTA